MNYLHSSIGIPISRTSLASEAVRIQKNNDLGYKIQAEFSKIHELFKSGKEVYPRELSTSKELLTVKKLIKERLGVTISIIVNGPLAAVLPFYSNKNHVMLHKEFRGAFKIGAQEAILKSAANKTASFDMETGKMGGLFAEYNHPVYINFEQLFHVYHLNAGEVTAVFLHEIGHIAAACEYTDRLESTNQVMASVAEYLFVKKNNPDLKYVYTELSKVDKKISQVEVEKMCTGNRVIAGYQWYKFVVRATGHADRTQMGNDTYDRTSFEALADNFSTRFGYGQDLVSALNKLHDTSLSPERYRVWMIAHQAMSAIAFFTIAAYIIIAIVGGALLLSVLVSWLFYSSIWSSAEDNKPHTYDTLKDRYKRIRDQYVAQLKDITLSKEDTEIILSNIELADETMRNTYKYSTIFEFFGNIVSSGAKNAITSIQEQQLMESLAHNDLFVQAAKLRNL